MAKARKPAPTDNEPTDDTPTNDTPPRVRGLNFSNAEDIQIVEGINAGLNVQGVAASLEGRTKQQVTGRVATMRRQLLEAGFKLPNFKGRRTADYSHLYEMATAVETE